MSWSDTVWRCGIEKEQESQSTREVSLWRRNGAPISFLNFLFNASRNKCHVSNCVSSLPKEKYVWHNIFSIPYTLLRLLSVQSTWETQWSLLLRCSWGSKGNKKTTNVCSTQNFPLVIDLCVGPGSRLSYVANLAPGFSFARILSWTLKGFLFLFLLSFLF